MTIRALMVEPEQLELRLSGEWIYWGRGSTGIPDLTRPWRNPCDEPYGAYTLGCTRRSGHTGRHAAGDGRQIWAVWR